MYISTNRIVRWTCYGAAFGVIFSFVTGLTSGNLFEFGIFYAVGYLFGGALAAALFAAVLASIVILFTSRSFRKPSAELRSTVLDGESVNSSFSDTPHTWPRSASGVIDYIRKHWRGELSLAHSYWINTFLVNIIFVTVITYLDHSLSDPFIALQTLAIYSILFLVLAIISVPIAIWQILGVWRSAGNRIAYWRRSGWSIAARAVCIISVLQMANMLHSMSQDAGAYVHLAKIGLGLTPEGRYSVTTIDRDNGILVEGPLDIGAVREFSTIANAAPNAFYVQLESEGGWVQTGIRLHHEIDRRNLATYVDKGCYSACTIAFLGGETRMLSEDAELGFHKPEMMGGSTWAKEGYEESERFVASLMRKKGVSSSFIREVQKTPFTDLWMPDIATLTEAGVITHILHSDGSYTAVVPEER